MAWSLPGGLCSRVHCFCIWRSFSHLIQWMQRDPSVPFASSTFKNTPLVAFVAFGNMENTAFFFFTIKQTQCRRYLLVHIYRELPQKALPVLFNRILFYFIWLKLSQLSRVRYLNWEKESNNLQNDFSELRQQAYRWQAKFSVSNGVHLPASLSVFRSVFESPSHLAWPLQFSCKVFLGASLLLPTSQGQRGMIGPRSPSWLCE